MSADDIASCLKDPGESAGSVRIVMEGSVTLQNEYTQNASFLKYWQRPVRKYNMGKSIQ